ncbi:uncharacterized protein HMPREF1541_00353 [Cyphellophora europaea CBS 101466]|uniref:Mid2 domain-containing protein n=1 Tax=Cyphellophora europaea (strain CBS 101466) TaxID=1220924 RepID=W2SE26_CYPE1|nr:uncharacterized protein HMPREF1541_00353 [Cyphellophora europaea CBS 101466]ETN46169.1 hypothetical protein HMPREF1541_00353 [Cyphellophora europaea CBS 101466]
MRIEDPDMRSPRDPSSRATEGLFTTEMGIRSNDADGCGAPAPTSTTKLSDCQRRATFVQHERRAEATVTIAAPEVVINVNDGTSNIAATTITPVSSDTVVALEDLGSVTIPANITATATTDMPSLTDTASITEPPTIVSSTTSVLSPAGSVLSDALNSTSTSFASADTIVTVTTTSTFEVSYLNGTLFPAVLLIPTDTISQSGRETSTRSSSEPSGIIVTAESSSVSATGSDGNTAEGAAATTTLEAPAATSSESSGGGGGSGPALTPQQQSVVGGVVGGIAGLALILVLILFLLRRYRAKLKAQGRLPEQMAQEDSTSVEDVRRGMSQRSSAIPLTATLASSLRRFRPMSSQTATTDQTASTAPEGERGFQKLAGRKIDPVLSTGGDGYGGHYGVFGAAGPATHQRNENSLADSSFYRDSRGFYGGTGADTPPYPASPIIGTDGEAEKAGPSSTRDFAGQGARTSSQTSVASSRPEVAGALRPSPARTPVTVSPSPSSIRLPIQQTPTMSDAPPMPPFAPGLHPDGVGRSLAHHDGSRVSARSRGSTRSRFAENV